MNALRLQALAVAASLSHVILDFGIGLYGTGQVLTPLQAANMTAYAVVYGMWAWALGAANASPSAVTVALILAAWWSAFAQGIIGFVACPPPCGSATGFQDATHLLSLVFGGWAAYATWRAARAGAGLRFSWPVAYAITLIVVSFVLQGLTFTSFER